MRASLALLIFLTGQLQADPSLAPILERAGEFVRRFEREFAIVISDERYVQKDVTTDDRARVRSRTERTIRSETLFAWVPEQQSWLTARSVQWVDGAAVPDSKARLDAALAEQGPDAATRLRRLRDEGARFNVGRIFRNFNDPTLVLQFLDPAYQPRFAFTRVGQEKVGGVETWRIQFAERARPTVIRAPTADLSSDGSIWIAREDGSVVRTLLVIKDTASNTTAEIDVTYRLDPRLGIRVPARMSEVYEQQVIVNLAPAGVPRRLAVNRERIECEATYSNYRRFETSGRLLAPGP